MPTTKARLSPETAKLTARIVSYRRSYFIGYMGVKNEFVDDEAVLDVEGVIERASKPYNKHLGLPVSFRMLHSERYGATKTRTMSPFGSISLQSRERWVLAYLPPQPFWALPDLISEGAQIIDCTFKPMRRGFGDLLSMYLGREEDLAEDAASS